MDGQPPRVWNILPLVVARAMIMTTMTSHYSHDYPLLKVAHTILPSSEYSCVMCRCRSERMAMYDVRSTPNKSWSRLSNTAFRPSVGSCHKHTRISLNINIPKNWMCVKKNKNKKLHERISSCISFIIFRCEEILHTWAMRWSESVSSGGIACHSHQPFSTSTPSYRVLCP